MPATPTPTSSAPRPSPYSRPARPSASSASKDSRTRCAPANPAAREVKEAVVALLKDGKWAAMSPMEQLEFLRASLLGLWAQLQTLEARRECGDALGQFLWPHVSERLIGKEPSKRLASFGKWCGVDFAKYAGRSGAFVLGEGVDAGIATMRKLSA